MKNVAEDILMGKQAGLGDHLFLGQGSALRTLKRFLLERWQSMRKRVKKEEVAKLVTRPKKWGKGQPEDTKYSERRLRGP